jgi:signal transduction histidine kinase
MRAPIRQIKAFSGFLAEDLGAALSIDAARDLQFIQEGAQKLDALLDGYTDLALATAQELNPDEIPIATGLNASKEGVNATLVRPTPYVFADPSIMRLVWDRVLEAAVRLSGGSEAIEVSLESVGDASSAIIVRVADPGIDASDLARAFLPVPMFNGHASDPGMALAVCYRAVVRMGGELKALADGDEHLILKIELPQHAPPPRTVDQTPASPCSASETLVC